jgi:hypothetical protein
MPSTGVTGGTEALLFVPIFLLAIAFYFFYCYCLKIICEKAGTEPGCLIWIPLLQIFPLLAAADMSPLWVLALFVPILNFIVGIVIWVKILEALDRSMLWILLMFIPVANIFVLPLLAFTD